MKYGNASLMRINVDSAEEAAEVLVNAFKDYPIFQSYFPNEANRKKVLYYLLSLSVYVGIKYGEVHTTSSNWEGIAIWIPSDNYPITIWKILCSVPLSIIFGLVRHGGSKMKGFGDYIDGVHQRLAPFKHWFLMEIGVDPRFRGKGYASRLITPMLSRIDEEHLPCYLETTDQKNISIYERFGFKIIDKSHVPQTNFTSWAMLRKA